MLFANHPPFTVIAETDDFIVIDKPALLKVHPNVPGAEPTLYDDLRELLAYELANGGQISLINRLDRETSGVTLVAKTAEAARRFGIAMMEHRFTKTYLAIVHGHPDWSTIECDEPILRKGERCPSPIWVKQMVHAEGAACSSAFRLVQRLAQPFALIECKPRTGRMHQLRLLSRLSVSYEIENHHP